MKQNTTKEVLESLGFDEKRAEELGKGGISTKTIIGNNHIVIDGRTNIVYSDIEGAKKYYFENGNLKFPTKCDSLREEYYNLRLKQYLNKNKATGLTDSDLAKEFRNAEIQYTENEIEVTNDKFKTFSKNPEFTKIKTRYLNWLKQPEPKQPEKAKENPYPLVFVNLDVYDRFIEYANKIDPKDYYKSYSYLKKRLEAEKLIHKQSDGDFMYFIYDELKLITKEQHKEYLTKGQLETTERTAGKGRKIYFDNTFSSLCL